MRKILLIVSVILYSIVARSQVSNPLYGVPQQMSQFEDKESFFKGFVIDFDNDFLLDVLGNLNEDRNYTQGFGLSLYINPYNNWLYDQLFWKPNQSAHRDLRIPMEASFRFAAFTPDDLRSKQHVVGDRPYSTVFFIGIKAGVLQSEHKLKTRSINIGMLGIYGPAKWLQTKIHESMNNNNTKPPYNPEGWHNQVSNGGEPTLLYTQDEMHLLTKKTMNRDKYITNHKKFRMRAMLAVNYGFNLGYLTEATSGITFKLGKIDYRRWYSAIYDNLGNTAKSASDDKIEHSGYFNEKKSWELYLFARVSPTFTLYNQSLHGGFRHSVYTLPYSETGFFNVQMRTGLVVSIGAVSLSAYIAAKTPEFYNHLSRMHYWGGFNFAVNF